VKLCPCLTVGEAQHGDSWICIHSILYTIGYKSLGEAGEKMSSDYETVRDRCQDQGGHAAMASDPYDQPGLP